MWVCKFCETENEDGHTACICCGHKHAEVYCAAARTSDGTANTGDMSKETPAASPKRAIIITVFAVLAALCIGFYTIHDWQPATCTEPEVCTICGKVRTPASGHEWIDATYYAPKTCASCGLTDGHVKGYIGVLNGVVSSEDVHVRGGQWSKALELAEPLDRCIKMTMELTVTDYSGDPFGAWCLYGRMTDGKWEYIGDFNIDERFINETLKTQFTFDPYVSFDALTMVQKDEQKYDINYTFKFSDAQHYID